jgi:diadenylate cyclase
MEFVMPILEGAWRYVLTLRVSDYLDIALMAYAIYWLLKLVGTSKVESVGKVILLFLLALMLSDAFSLNGIYFLLSHILSLGALALIVLFQPEIRRLIDQLGSSRWRSSFSRTPDWIPKPRLSLSSAPRRMFPTSRLRSTAPATSLPRR